LGSSPKDWPLVQRIPWCAVRGALTEDRAMDATGSKDRRLLDDRVRILAALSQALEDRVAVLQLVGEAEDRDRAREALMAAYGWDKVESTAVLDLQLHHASRSERERIAEELHETRERLKAIQ
jgi:DNA gyrase/topoisomerase IV subunit A